MSVHHVNGPARCTSNKVVDDVQHFCLGLFDHPGPHHCDLDDHETPSCADGCCHDPCPVTWPSSPKQMRRGSWTIDDARRGDVIGDPSWPADRRLTLTYVGQGILVGTSPMTKGNEIALHPRAFDFVLYDMELIADDYAEDPA